MILFGVVLHIINRNSYGGAETGLFDFNSVDSRTAVRNGTRYGDLAADPLLSGEIGGAVGILGNLGKHGSFFVYLNFARYCDFGLIERIVHTLNIIGAGVKIVFGDLDIKREIRCCSRIMFRNHFRACPLGIGALFIQNLLDTGVVIQSLLSVTLRLVVGALSADSDSFVCPLVYRLGLDFSHFGGSYILQCRNDNGSCRRVARLVLENKGIFAFVVRLWHCKDQLVAFRLDLILVLAEGLCHVFIIRVLNASEARGYGLAGVCVDEFNLNCQLLCPIRYAADKCSFSALRIKGNGNGNRRLGNNFRIVDRIDADIAEVTAPFFLSDREVRSLYGQGVGAVIFQLVCPDSNFLSFRVCIGEINTLDARIDIAAVIGHLACDDYVGICP